MKKIMKTEGIITNLMRQSRNGPDNAKNPAWAYISYRAGDRLLTSQNMINVIYNAKNGQHIYVYYVEGKPEKVFKYAVTARLFG